jgi:hypothetical protein
MGRGLGKMQRLIIEELRRQKGGVWIERPWSYDINLPEGVHDLRHVSYMLARRHGGISHQWLLAMTKRWHCHCSIRMAIPFEGKREPLSADEIDSIPN